MQFAIQFLELQYLADEEVSVAMCHLRVGNVNHVVINVEVQLKEHGSRQYKNAEILLPDLFFLNT